MEQAAELAFVDRRASGRDLSGSRDSLGPSNRRSPSLLGEAAPAGVRGEIGLRRTGYRPSAPVMRQRGGPSSASSALHPRSGLASSDALSLREWVQLALIGAVVLLSPVLVFLAAIAVEIAIDLLMEAGAIAVAIFVAAGAVGWLLLRTRQRHQVDAPVET
jgi:hypothetical protein